MTNTDTIIKKLKLRLVTQKNRVKLRDNRIAGLVRGFGLLKKQQNAKLREELKQANETIRILRKEKK